MKPTTTALISFALLMAVSCTPQALPSPEQLSQADYGPEPDIEKAPQTIRRYLKTSGYYDPNGAEIEECKSLGKGWRLDHSAEIYPSFVFGYRVACDINGKNRMGGFIGFKTIEYLLRGDKVLAGRLPDDSQGSLPIVTPGSEFVIWR